MCFPQSAERPPSIGVGRTHEVEFPPLRIGRAEFPHPAFRWMVHLGEVCQANGWVVARLDSLWSAKKASSHFWRSAPRGDGPRVPNRLHVSQSLPKACLSWIVSNILLEVLAVF